MNKCKTMLTVVMAKHPRVFSFFFFFFRYHFFSLKGETQRPVHFIWNYILDRETYYYFLWKIEYRLSKIKEETNYNLHPYINLSWRLET